MPRPPKVQDLYKSSRIAASIWIWVEGLPLMR